MTQQTPDQTASLFSGGSTGYTSSPYTEAMRLHVQAGFSEELDGKLLSQAYDLLGRHSGLTAMDFGCADGFVTQARLTGDRGFVKVIGLDRDQSAIEWAQKRAADGYSYYQIDIEQDDFLRKAHDIMEAEGAASFDVIYSALTLHHLHDQVGALRKLNELLSPDGVIIVRGVDDGAQLFFDCGQDDGPIPESITLVDDITRLSVSTPGMSNRFHGRQLYGWLRQAGFREIRSEYSVADTVGRSPEEREALFQYMLAFRSNYTERALERCPGDPARQAAHDDMRSKLAAVRSILVEDPNSYYMVTAFGMAAKKAPSP